MPRRVRHTLKPEVLGLETRAVPTVISPLAFHGAGLKAIKDVAAANARLAQEARPDASTTGGANNPTGGSGATLPGAGTSNPTLDPATLTPAGLARAKFSALASGPIALGKPSYVGIAKQVFYIGNSSTSQFLHGTFVMRIDVPTDPSLPITGVAELRDLSVATTGNQAVLDLTGTATDRFGRPTQLTWTVDSSSSGSFTNAPGQGTLSISYRPDGHSRLSAGGATSVFHGLILPSNLGTNINFDIPKFA